MNRTWSFFVVALSASGAFAGCQERGRDTGGTVIRFLHYNDLHAHLVDHKDLVTDEGSTQAKIAMRGGIARLATLVKQLRTENPASVLMNIGDTYHGGVEALYTQGEAVAIPANALAIDVGVPGNWDYAYGPGVTRLRYTGEATKGMLECVQMGYDQGGGGGGGGELPSLTRPSFPNLAANITYKTGPGANPGDPFLPPTLMKEIGGVTVGFIGISSDIVPRMHPMLSCGLTFLGADDLASGDSAAWAEKYKDLVETQAGNLRSEGAQIVVVMSELGLQKDFYLAGLVAPDLVDVFFSAHTHEAVFAPLESASGALVVEAGDDGYLGRMDIRVKNGLVVDRSWKLLPITSDIPEDAETKGLVDQARAPFLVADPNLQIPGATGAPLALHESIATVIGYVPTPLDRKNALDSTFNDFFTEALRSRAATQLAMAPGFRFDSPIPTAASLVETNVIVDGAMTLEDAYRFFPVVYAMGTAQVTGDVLGGIVEDALKAVFSPTIPLQNGGWVEGFAGLRLQVDLAAPDDARLQTMALLDGTPMATSATFTIAGCRRPFDATDVLCSHSGLTNVQDFVNPATGTAWTNVEILRDGLAHTSDILSTPALTDVSGTPLWPESPWIQPLQGVGP